jgi:hypothetical protein
VCPSKRTHADARRPNEFFVAKRWIEQPRLRSRGFVFQAALIGGSVVSYYLFATCGCQRCG